MVRILIVSPLQTAGEWNEFLRSFAAAIGGEWPGSPALSEEHLLSVENRLKIKLPPSYRAFLLVSNGWRRASREVPVLRPVEKIEWFKKEHRDWVQAYVDPMQGMGALLPAEQDYFNYGGEKSSDFEPKHLAHALCISEIGDDAVLLLNPMVIWPDGEWEAWLFANWIPGAIRYRSFADWMRHEHAGLTDDTFKHSTIPGELPTVYLDGPAKVERRARPRENILAFDAVKKDLASNTRSRRLKAVRQLGRIANEGAVTVLLGLLKSDYDYHVRCEAAEVLGKIHAQQAIEALIAVSTEESHVTSSAVEALGNFNDEVSAQRLLRMVEEDGPSGCVATHALAKRNDSRAVPLLVAKLVSDYPADRHTGNIAGRLIADFQGAGLAALEPLAIDADMEIRRRAIVGLGDLAFAATEKLVKAKAHELLRKSLETETDSELRRLLEVQIEITAKKSA